MCHPAAQTQTLEGSADGSMHDVQALAHQVGTQAQSAALMINQYQAAMVAAVQGPLLAPLTVSTGTCCLPVCIPVSIFLGPTAHTIEKGDAHVVMLLTCC